ncbi:MAG: phenylacetate--CoA ligase family protein [Nitrospira sp.]|nr:phenylacetate--CoA ligase family protein [Nitrospira sp.]
MPLEDLLYPFLKSYTSAPQWVKSAVGSVYARIPSGLKYGSAYARFHSEAMCTDEQTLRESIDQKLTATLTGAIQTVSAYEEYRSLLATSIAPLELLRQIRPITKEMIKNQPDQFVSSSFTAYHRMPMFTGGSTAQPMRFYLQKHITRPKESAYVDMWMESLGVCRQDITLVLRGRTVPTAGKPNGRLWMYDPIRRQLILSCDHLEPEYMAGYVQPLRMWKPTFIHAFPSAVYALAKWLQYHPAVDITERVRAILLTSETIYDYQLAAIQAVFACPIIPHYGHSERVLMAAGRFDDSRYLFWPQYGHFELLDPYDTPITQPGVIGEIVGTSFDNHVMPFIRYRTGDFAALSDRHHLKFPLYPVCERIEGRLQEFVVCHDHRLVSITTLGAAHFDLLSDVHEIQYEQHEPGKIVLNVVATSPLSKAIQGAIARAVEQKTQNGCTLEVRRVYCIERTERGKHRMMIQHLDIRRYLGSSHTSTI